MQQARFQTGAAILAISDELTTGAAAVDYGTHPVRVSALHGCCIQRSTAFPSSFCKVINRI